jgi:hypothetical protein
VAAPLSVLPSALGAYPDHLAELARLRAFRASLHACCTHRADALVELADTLLSAQGPVASLPHLSLEPAHRRGWGSLYAALACGRIDAERLRDLLAGHPLAGGQPIYAVDVTTWPRCDAECSPERGLYYHPSRHSAASRSWPAGRSSGSASWASRGTPGPPRWTLAGCIRWMTPITPPPARSARCLIAYPPTGRPRGLCSTPATTPRSCRWTWPSARGGAGAAAVRPLLLRRPATTPTRRRRPATPPRRQVHCADPATWPAPTITHVATDDQYGTVTVHAWSGLHPKQHRHPGHGSGGPRPIVRGTIIRVQVQRIPAKTRPPKVLWLWWAGPAGCALDLELAWRVYTRRFDLEHTVRFCKQTLGWTTPRPRHPAQAERWTWLVLAAYTQLRLARQFAGDQRLAWERPRPPGQLSPYRVRRGFSRLLCAVGSPAAAPKPSGRSPGRPKGSSRGPATRYPAIKKPTTKPRKKATATAKAA